MNRDRCCEVGDLLIREDRDGNKNIGLVTGVDPMILGGSTSVFVEWTTGSPSDYNFKYGYSLINVHNQHHLFTIEKTNK